MTAPVRTVSAQTPIEGAADIMATHRIRRLPVLEDGRLAGILTSSDIVRVYLDADRVIRQVVVKGSAARAGEE
jgi:CBS domain-containing protein